LPSVRFPALATQTSRRRGRRREPTLFAQHSQAAKVRCRWQQLTSRRPKVLRSQDEICKWLGHPALYVHGGGFEPLTCWVRPSRSLPVNWIYQTNPEGRPRHPSTLPNIRPRLGVGPDSGATMQRMGRRRHCSRLHLAGLDALAPIVGASSAFGRRRRRRFAGGFRGTTCGCVPHQRRRCSTLMVFQLDRRKGGMGIPAGSEVAERTRDGLQHPGREARREAEEGGGWYAWAARIALVAKGVRNRRRAGG
jgi:hypothetical protein